MTPFDVRWSLAFLEDIHDPKERLLQLEEAESNLEALKFQTMRLAFPGQSDYAAAYGEWLDSTLIS